VAIRKPKMTRFWVVPAFLLLLAADGASSETEPPAPLSEELGMTPVSVADGHAASLGPKTAILPRSVEVIRDDTIVRRKPSTKVLRRGVVVKGARLPVRDQAEGFGCDGPWYRVYDEGWICSDEVRVSPLPPEAPHYPVVPEGELTPWPYGFVRQPTVEYRMENGALVEVRDVLKGFGFGIHSIVRRSGIKFFRTPAGTLIKRSDAGMTSRISTYRGMPIRDGRPWPVGFVNSPRAYIYDTPTRGREHRVTSIERFTPFEVLEQTGKGPSAFYRFDDGGWLAARDVRVVRKASPPKSLEPGERWIDVDTHEQLITAYEGDRPVYTALMSSGRYGPSSTVKGEYRIWAKVSAIAMDNTDEELEEETATDEKAPLGEGETEVTKPTADGEEKTEESRHLYSLQDVPWTQFFFESYALHGVYWHNGFGNRRSHGCVNLAPGDAHWFYDWSEPRVPEGWWAVHTTDKNPGTIVKVR